MPHFGLTAVTHPVTPNGRLTRCRGKPSGRDPQLGFFFGASSGNGQVSPPLLLEAGGELRLRFEKILHLHMFDSYKQAEVMQPGRYFKLGKSGFDDTNQRI
jgi:hypothetical protein